MNAIIIPKAKKPNRVSIDLRAVVVHDDFDHLLAGLCDT